MFLIADRAGAFDPHMAKLWEVSRRCCDIQVELQKEGATCSSIAYAIHKYQIEQGVQKFVYHRPAHGAGVEGHQPPYLALGLYDTARGCGFNWSDTVVTAVKAGYRMNRVPYSKEWCWIKLYPWT